MYIRKQQLLLLLFIIFCNCSKNKEIIDDTVINDYVKSEQLSTIEERLIDTIFFKNYSIIPLETTNESLFKNINRICRYNDMIYIYDGRMSKIIIFDENGKYVNNIHNIGQGPKEYISAIDFCVDEITGDLILMCDKPYKIIRFSKDGKFINEINFSGLKMSITMDSGYFLCESFNTSEDCEIECFDNKFNLIYSKLRKFKTEKNSCFSGGKSLVKNKNIYYTRRFDPSIYFLNKDCIVKKYEFDFGKYKVPIELSEEEDCDNFFNSIRDNKYIFSITNVVESERYILFNTNLCICLYEKKTNKLKAFNVLYNTSLLFGSNKFFVNEGCENSLITLFQPNWLENYDEETIKNNSVLKNLLSNSKEYDNPILIIFDFKE